MRAWDAGTQPVTQQREEREKESERKRRLRSSFRHKDQETRDHLTASSKDSFAERQQLMPVKDIKIIISSWCQNDVCSCWCFMFSSRSIDCQLELHFSSSPLLSASQFHGVISKDPCPDVRRSTPLSSRESHLHWPLAPLSLFGACYI